MRRESGAIPSALALDAPLPLTRVPDGYDIFSRRDRPDPLAFPHPIAVTSRRHVEKLAPPFLADKRDIS